MKSRLIIIVPIALLCFLIMAFFVSCNNNRSASINSENTQLNFKSMHKTTKPGSLTMSYRNLEGNETVGFNARRGNRIKIRYKSKCKSGVLTISINDAYGSTVQSIPINKRGTLYIRAKEDGKFTITVTAKNTTGHLKVTWRKQIL